MKFLTQNDPAIDALFGEISPPAAMNIGGSDPVQGLGNFIAFGINMFILVAGLFLILYLLWGAFDWINSGGEKEKISKAQSKITHALIGMFLVFAVLAIFNLFAGRMLGIVEEGGSGFEIKLPTLGQ
ncbi:MAG: hypothetical protein WC894_04085 [Patescibacteria group bacterium]